MSKPGRLLVGAALLAVNLLALAAIGFSWGTGDSDGVLSPSDRAVTAPFLEGREEGLVLVYFGYVGCGSTCPLSLQALAQVYRQDKAAFADGAVGVTFVTLQQDMPAQAADLYAKGYHLDFTGAAYSGETFQSVVRTFEVFFSPSLIDRNTIHHPNTVYLLQRQGEVWYLRHMYLAFPADAERVVQDLARLRRENRASL